MTDIKQIVANLGNPDNNIRQQAEQLLENAKRQNLVCFFCQTFTIYQCVFNNH